MRVRDRLSVVTVGCKANFADSAAILAHAAHAGFDVVGDGASADVLVINSCTVTRRADRIAGRWPGGCAASTRTRSS